MKRIISVILAALVTGAAMHAQDTGNSSVPSNHLAFKGHPITGLAEQFRRELRQDGFASSGMPSLNILKGGFAGHNVMVYLATTPISHNVYGVYVYTEPRDSWSDVLCDFMTFRKHLCVVYGECTGWLDAECSKFAENPYLKDEARPFEALAQWELENGCITVLPDKAEDGRGRILISYVDRLGSEIHRRETDRKIQADL